MEAAARAKKSLQYPHTDETADLPPLESGITSEKDVYHPSAADMFALKTGLSGANFSDGWGFNDSPIQIGDTLTNKALNIAARLGDNLIDANQVFKILIKGGANLLHKDVQTGRTALETAIACCNPRAEIIEYLRMETDKQSITESLASLGMQADSSYVEQMLLGLASEEANAESLESPLEDRDYEISTLRESLAILGIHADDSYLEQVLIDTAKQRQLNKDN